MKRSCYWKNSVLRWNDFDRGHLQLPMTGYDDRCCRYSSVDADYSRNLQTMLTPMPLGDHREEMMVPAATLLHLKNATAAADGGVGMDGTHQIDWVEKMVESGHLHYDEEAAYHWERD